MELAKDTVDILNEKGWKQGPANLDDTRLCLGEAIGTATMKSVAASQEEEVQQVEQMTKLRLAIEANIQKTYPEDYASWVNVITWNDAPGRTKQDVMEVLDKTIDILIPKVV